MVRQFIFFVAFFFLFVPGITVQQKDSLILLNDTVSRKTPVPVKKKMYVRDSILKQNIFLNSAQIPGSFIQVSHKYTSKDMLFYVLAIILLFLGILKIVYSRYFSNLIRVFFNTSLRQGQLTDQLLQARLPSMFFNLFFVAISGWYLYLLLNYFRKIVTNSWYAPAICFSVLLLVYMIKFFALKFTGWLTGYRQEANTYIFIVFMVNKVISLCLVPVVIIISFSQPKLVTLTVIISYIMIALMLMMRFFRSYGLLRSRLKITPFHFFLYITGIELLPLLLIYKGALVIMSKNL